MTFNILTLELPHMQPPKFNNRKAFTGLLLALGAIVWLLWLNTLWTMFPGLVRHRITQVTDGYTHFHSAPAKFGPVPPVKGFHAPLVYVEGNGCNIDPKKLGGYNFKGAIAMVHEGKCHYDELVTIYEMFGAKGVIVTGGTSPVEVEPMKAESHIDVSIPSVKVGRLVAEKLKTQNSVFIYGEPSPKHAIVESIFDTLMLVFIWGLFGFYMSVQDTTSIMLNSDMP